MKRGEIKKRTKKQKANQGISNQEVKKKLNAALDRLGEPHWVGGRLVKREKS
jgi:hypothetical protein